MSKGRGNGVDSLDRARPMVGLERESRKKYGICVMNETEVLTEANVDE